MSPPPSTALCPPPTLWPRLRTTPALGGCVWGDIHIHIDINMNIDIYIIIVTNRPYWYLQALLAASN